MIVVAGSDLLVEFTYLPLQSRDYTLAVTADLCRDSCLSLLGRWPNNSPREDVQSQVDWWVGGDRILPRQLNLPTMQQPLFLLIQRYCQSIRLPRGEVTSRT